MNVNEEIKRIKTALDDFNYLYNDCGNSSILLECCANYISTYVYDLYNKTTEENDKAIIKRFVFDFLNSHYDLDYICYYYSNNDVNRVYDLINLFSFN